MNEQMNEFMDGQNIFCKKEQKGQGRTKRRKMSTMRESVILGGPTSSRVPQAAVFLNSKHSPIHARYAFYVLQLHLNKLKALVLSITVNTLHVPFGHQLLGRDCASRSHENPELSGLRLLSQRQRWPEGRGSLAESCEYPSTKPKRDGYISLCFLSPWMSGDPPHSLSMVRYLPS